MTRKAMGGGLILAALVITTAGAAEEKVVYKTPEKAFEAAQGALAKNNWKAFLACLTEQSRDTFAGQLAMVGVMYKGIAEFDKTGKAKEKFKPIDVTLEKHGLTDKFVKKLEKSPPKDPKEMAKRVKTLIAPIKDKSAFVADMMKAMEKAGGKKENMLGGVKLKDVKIDGKKAKGDLVYPKKDKKDPVEFVKVGDGWLIDLPMDKGKGPGK
jgi:hypothetical protein